MFQALLEVLGAGLELWTHKEKTKFVEKKMKLERAWYDEYNKGPNVRSNAVLDSLEFELRVLASAFVVSVGKQNA